MTRLSLRLGAALAASAAVAFSGAAHATNLLTNGSFEDTTNFVDQGSDTMFLPVGSTTMPGWTVISDNIAWIGPSNPYLVNASDGAYFLDLTALHGPTGGVQQTVATVAGASYLLTFDLGSSYIYGLQDGLHVAAGASGADFASTNDGTQIDLWEPESFVFVATGASTTISLVANLGFNAVGLDHLSLVETAGPPNGGVPEPATWAFMLLGFGGLGAMLRRRTRHGQSIAA